MDSPLNEGSSDSVDPDGVGAYELVVSPGKSKSYVPVCDVGKKPYIGQIFQTIEEGIIFYQKYASECGFDIRRSSDRRFSDGTMNYKVVVCNREGEKNSKSGKTKKIDLDKSGRFVENDDKMSEGGDCEIARSDVPGKKKIRRVSKRCGCLARIMFKFSAGVGYVVYDFKEEHRHIFVSALFKPLLKVNKNLDSAHKTFLLKCAKANIGATKSYRLYKEFVSGYSNVGCTNVEFKNFVRDLKAYVVGFDAQMLLEKLFREKEISPGFVFEYAVDEKDKLTRLFWADDTCRRNYAIFGDCMSFDATYSTNRYNMIFTPFTGKDNHGKCVTFGIGLICSEDVGAYSWLFENFVKHMGRAPLMIITDQDPAMKIAIARVLLNTRQRFCMWHILNKVPQKVPSRLKDDKSFKCKLKSVVYSNLLEPEEFVVSWNQIMEEFGLVDNKWFQSIFAIREMWIPAYFREFSMSRLFRTTSMSESENCFFRNYSNPRANLLEFYMNIGSALDSQRNTLFEVNGEEETRIPSLETRLAIENHAASIYTDLVFRNVQMEISDACFECCVASMGENEDGAYYEVEDRSKGVFKVVYDKDGETTVCSCKKFVREGLLCAHMFFVLKELRFQKIPDKYVVKRWTKDAYKYPIHDVFGSEAGVNLQRKVCMQKIMSEFYSCVGLVEGNDDNMGLLLSGLGDMKASFVGSASEMSNVAAKRKLFDDFHGVKIPEDVRVLPPSPVNNKGSRKRFKSGMEKAVKINEKPKRLCSRCDNYVHHDARNCPTLLK